MYILLLILKYLRRKLAPLFAMLAVMLCTAMVIIVISVMGGFLELMREAGKKLTGDVIVTSDIRGFPHYEDLIARIEALPEAAAATPVIKGYGLINIRGGVFPVEALGIQPQGLDRVIGFRQALHWDSATFKAAVEGEFQRLDLDPNTIDPNTILPGSAMDRLYNLWRDIQRYELKDMGMALRAPAEWSSKTDNQNNASNDSSDDESLTVPGMTPGMTPGMVPGIHVSPFTSRDSEGAYEPLNSILTGLYNGGREATLTILGVDETGMPTNPETRRLTVVNEFKSGLYEVDANQVFLPFDVLQSMLELQAAPEIDFDTGQLTGRTIPARTHEIMIRAADGVTLDDLYTAVFDVREAWAANHPAGIYTHVITWEQKHATLLNAVKNEKGLITFLFAFISMVAVVMIATTFYMIVLEKTRDIGVLRAIGASRIGIANIFISYGLLLGMIGAAAGLALGVTIVHNLNEIQEGLYELTLWWTDGAWGWRMWDPRTYYFDSIPESVDYTECTFIVTGAVVSSVLGAMIPAFLAARLKPVDALRYE